VKEVTFAVCAVYRRQRAVQTAAVALPPDLFTMGDLVWKLRLRLKWTQKQLAKRAGISVSAVRGLEDSPHRSSRHTIVAVAQALGVEEVDLVGFEKRLGQAEETGHVRRVAGKVR